VANQEPSETSLQCSQIATSTQRWEQQRLIIQKDVEYKKEQLGFEKERLREELRNEREKQSSKLASLHVNLHNDLDALRERLKAEVDFERHALRKEIESGISWTSDPCGLHH
jgi:hypothetical protein